MTQGDVVLIGPPTEQGDFLDVSHWYVQLFLEKDRFKGHAQRVEDMQWREHERVFDDWERPTHLSC